MIFSKVTFHPLSVPFSCIPVISERGYTVEIIGIFVASLHFWESCDSVVIPQMMLACRGDLRE